MKLLFVADPLASFKIAKDTTFAMMREAQQRGHALAVCTPQGLSWQQGLRVQARVQDIALTGQADDWFSAQPERLAALADFDAVLMRKDPPFDSEYFYATHLLEQAEREGARVFNRPRALRDHPEKLAVMEFPQLIGPTLVTRSSADIRAFHAQHQDIILKPLDGMGGMGSRRYKTLNDLSSAFLASHHYAHVLEREFLAGLRDGWFDQAFDFAAHLQQVFWQTTSVLRWRRWKRVWNVVCIFCSDRDLPAII